MSNTIVNPTWPGAVMPSATTVPGKVACEVREFQAIKTKRVGALQVLESTTTLVDLKVVFPMHGESKLKLLEGDTAYVYATNFDQPGGWGKVSYVLDGKTFILVPEEEVVMVKSHRFFLAPYTFIQDGSVPYQTQITVTK